ncbi:MAG: DNA polymerase III subunit gamma/tau [Planctomycetota bacterium]|nr:DNA polymerase III subunit gamma/tau [Planctomycetota bacterium]
MDYLVIARKYRPQTFAEVAGQDVISRTLTNAIGKGRIAHGFLFTGPSGVGKTTMARILAKALSCETGITSEPCGVCDHCKMIADSTHPDVFEIDAATHNGVDDVRELAERATYSPTMGRYRIYILDEVHMLSQAAWNALLKLLEEPPPHVYFIFATTEIEKVPATVVNRCQRFDFRSIDREDIVDRLRDISRAEGINLEDPLLMRIARAAAGGMREAQTMLDQLIAMCDKEVTENDLNLLLGAARSDDLRGLVDDLLKGNAAGAIEALDRLCADGVAPATFLEQLVEYVRMLLLITTCGPESAPVQRLGSADDTARAQAEGAGADKLLRMGQILVGSQQSMRHGVDARLQLELAFVRIGQLGEVLDVDGLLRRIERMEKSFASHGGLAASPR